LPVDLQIAMELAAFESMPDREVAGSGYRGRTTRNGNEARGDEGGVIFVANQVSRGLGYAAAVVTPEDRTLSENGGAPGPRDLGIVAGTRVGRYVIEHELGAGGMGVVYAARDPELDRAVAVKVLRAPQDEGASKASAGRTRLLREAQAMARLSHRNVVTVYDVGEYDGHVFIAMELVAGVTLATWIREHHPAVSVRVAAFIEAGRGLAQAHAAGLVHRDFKPENVMVVLDASGRVTRVLVMDFGLARSASVVSVGTGETPVPPDLVGLELGVTRTGALLGTPAYMSPEQHAGGLVDERSDQFAYCVSLFEVLYGVRPFEGDNAMALAFAAMEGNVRDVPASSSVAPWLRRAVMRGLAPDPGGRWPSMAALVAELDRDRTRPRRLVLAAARRRIPAPMRRRASMRSGPPLRRSGSPARSRPRGCRTPTSPGPACRPSSRPGSGHGSPRAGTRAASAPSSPPPPTPRA
jgi:serine/threonine protein kinase